MQRMLAAVLTMAIALGGCHEVMPSTPAATHGYVTDTHAFDAFIATRPTPAQFHAAYPDVQLVMPGTITTMEFRTNNSRYFPELDKDGRIASGHFG